MFTLVCNGADCGSRGSVMIWCSPTHTPCSNAGCYPVLHKGCQVGVIFAYLALYMLQVQHNLLAKPNVFLPVGSAWSFRNCMKFPQTGSDIVKCRLTNGRCSRHDSCFPHLCQDFACKQTWFRGNGNMRLMVVKLHDTTAQHHAWLHSVQWSPNNRRTSDACACLPPEAGCVNKTGGVAVHKQAHQAKSTENRGWTIQYKPKEDTIQT